jgi:two-component system chemotaxis response regulator CheY
MRVLVVDDSKAMRAIVKRHVEQAGLSGLEFEEAEDGTQALSQIRANPPDVVLSDWNMPNMNGIELLEAMRAEGLTVPFGFVTSESQESYKDRAFDAGALFMIAKPFTAEDFSRHLARFA